MSLVPKSIALSNPERYATLLSPVMILLTKVSYPFVCLLSVSTKTAQQTNRTENGEERPMTQEELKMILHQSSEQGVIDKEETEMLRDVFRFSDKRANESDDSPPRSNRATPYRHARRSASDYPRTNISANICW
ncbi:MAG: CNNM domain-containing protein [Bacteroides stercoris]